MNLCVDDRSDVLDVRGAVAARADVGTSRGDAVGRRARIEEEIGHVASSFCSFIYFGRCYGLAVV